jgi:hypothetical protein
LLRWASLPMLSRLKGKSRWHESKSGLSNAEIACYGCGIMVQRNCCTCRITYLANPSNCIEALKRWTKVHDKRPVSFLLYYASNSKTYVQTSCMKLIDAHVRRRISTSPMVAFIRAPSPKMRRVAYSERSRQNTSRKQLSRVMYDLKGVEVE